jgi:hypothetical protein
MAIWSVFILLILAIATLSASAETRIVGGSPLPNGMPTDNKIQADTQHRQLIGGRGGESRAPQSCTSAESDDAEPTDDLLTVPRQRRS